MPVAEPQAEASGSSRPAESHGREKRKARKVTFDVQPVEDSDRNDETEADSSEAMDLVFDLEDEVGERALPKAQPALEELAPVPRNGRTRTVRAQPNPSPRCAQLPYLHRLIYGLHEAHTNALTRYRPRQPRSRPAAYRQAEDVDISGASDGARGRDLETSGSRYAEPSWSVV
ncbi:hypothetical protein HGRIS_001081 [Hohenbuehelia grisea]|uniref:Uncharacterized protein n=1 Tax=Hohenbuehelia grisea TaxID=104357 RepID=A0ABR3JNF1_9AGAR